jgi:hypothetical protein
VSWGVASTTSLLGEASVSSVSLSSPSSLSASQEPIPAVSYSISAESSTPLTGINDTDPQSKTTAPITRPPTTADRLSSASQARPEVTRFFVRVIPSHGGGGPVGIAKRFSFLAPALLGSTTVSFVNFSLLQIQAAYRVQSYGSDIHHPNVVSFIATCPDISRHHATARRWQIFRSNRIGSWRC